jgi:O-antigen/teichoic acid export membrane protein
MNVLQRLHARLGDFWWYSLMLFFACRAADFLNAFVGLWLVPKYVPPAELGAVMPLTNFANCLALPLAVFASTFRSEISTLALRREFGRLKTLMRGVFIATGVFLILALTISHVLLPRFLERIRIVEGSLGLLILFSAFVGAVAPIYGNALQALKKFRATSLINILGAPIRLATMLLTMPLRPIAGYFAGQTATPLFTSVAALFALRRELSLPAAPYWTPDVIRRFGRLFLLFAIGSLTAAVAALVETTVIRQRLPEVESAAYYMVTRFSDIANFLYSTLVFTIFPFTADLAAKGEDRRPLILKATATTALFSGLLALVFALFGRSILACLPHGSAYSPYWWATPWIIGILTLNAAASYYTTAEISANRFGYLRWMVPINLLYPAALLLVTGHGYLTGIVPDSVLAAIRRINATSLQSILWWMTAVAALRFTGALLAMTTSRRHAPATTPPLPPTAHTSTP